MQTGTDTTDSPDSRIVPVFKLGQPQQIAALFQYGNWDSNNRQLHCSTMQTGTATTDSCIVPVCKLGQPQRRSSLIMIQINWYTHSKGNKTFPAPLLKFSTSSHHINEFMHSCQISLSLKTLSQSNYLKQQQQQQQQQQLALAIWTVLRVPFLSKSAKKCAYVTAERLTSFISRELSSPEAVSISQMKLILKLKTL